jgi:two-component system, OmpR family, response regulator MtrA
MNPTNRSRQDSMMAIPTVFLVGVERLPLVPEYLNLGSVVVVAPDQDTLRRWTWEQDSPHHQTDGSDVSSGGTVVDLAGRRIVSDGATLPLSDLEYLVLSALLSPIGRALSFQELRSCGWGDGPELPADVYSVRALVQRLRAKLESAGADIAIEAVRGFGFRAVSRDRPLALIRGEAPR